MQICCPAKFICLFLIFGLTVQTLADTYGVIWTEGIDPSITLQSETLHVGDSLLILNPWNRPVFEVNEEEYNSCELNYTGTLRGENNLINYDISQTGPFYLASSLIYCLEGLKLSKVVS
ncbi:hypothetical protein ACH5RR_030171 [Cinchona calisaya]|uniref:Uncharacterized protein n=1 Tax=Cinchona calisaya TaxID=153742 RepID=A0ABD2YTS9_9GENT